MKKLPRVTKKNAGYYLRVWRAERDLSIRNAASSFGITPSHLSLIESGLRGASPDVAIAMAAATGAPIDTFFVFKKDRL